MLISVRAQSNTIQREHMTNKLTSTKLKDLSLQNTSIPAHINISTKAYQYGAYIKLHQHTKISVYKRIHIPSHSPAGKPALKLITHAKENHHGRGASKIILKKHSSTHRSILAYP